MQCIQHIQLQQGAACDILIVDNASTDGTAQALEPLAGSGEILYFNTGSNLGGAGGFQFGLKQAYSMGYQYFWMMDDDTFPEQYALRALVQTGEELQNQYGFLSSAAYWKDGSLCNMNIQRVTFNKKQTDFVSARSPVVMATFVSFFFRREVLEKIGLPIKEFFIWSDDLEYSRRISRLLPCYLVNGSRVLHYMGSNEKVGIERDEVSRLWRYSYLYRNEVYLYRREGIKGWLYLLARIMLHSLRVLRSQTENKGKKLSIIWGSFFKGLCFFPEVEYVQGS